MTSERNTLPGGPGNNLVRKVRAVLYAYCRSKPQQGDRLWHMAWEWAYAIRSREEVFHLTIGYRPRKKPWPSAQEIASQYLLLCLVEMRSCRALRLPHNAAEYAPASVAAHLQNNGNIGSGDLSVPLLESQSTGEQSTEPPFVTR